MIETNHDHGTSVTYATDNYIRTTAELKNCEDKEEMNEPTQEQLLTIIDRAIDLYQLCQPIKGMLPSATKIYSIVRTCGLKVAIDRVKLCREIALVRRTSIRSGECEDAS